MKKIIAIIMTLMTAVTFMPSMGIANADTVMAKAKTVKMKRPEKVKWQKCVASSDKITLKWKKSKNAKKYEVFQLKAKKYKKIKTLKARKLMVKKLKSGTKYIFKVRGVNGKKKGSYSAKLIIKTKPVKKSPKKIQEPDNNCNDDKSKEEPKQDNSGADETNKANNTGNPGKDNTANNTGNLGKDNTANNTGNPGKDNTANNNREENADNKEPEKRPFIQAGGDYGYTIQGWTEPGAKVTAEYLKWNKSFRREVIADKTGKYQIDFINYVPYTITVWATDKTGGILCKETVNPDDHISDDQSKPFVTEDSACNKKISGWASPGGTVKIGYTWRILNSDNLTYMCEDFEEVVRCDEKTGYYSCDIKQAGGTVNIASVVAKTAEGKYYWSEKVDYLADEYDSSKKMYPEFLIAGTDNVKGIVEPGSEIIVTSGTETYNTYARSDGSYTLDFFMDSNREINLLVKNGNKVLYNSACKIWKIEEVEKYYADKVIKERGITTNMTDLEKAKLVAEWLCDHMSYSRPLKFNPGIAGLISQTGVCYTYMEAYELLLSSEEINVKNRNVFGPNHGWNQVFVDGEWYNVDVTWMDNDNNKGYNYNWFMISNEKAIKIGGDAHSYIKDRKRNNVMEATSKRFDSFKNNGWWETDEWKNRL